MGTQRDRERERETKERAKGRENMVSIRSMDLLQTLHYLRALYWVKGEGPLSANHRDSHLDGGT